MNRTAVRAATPGSSLMLIARTASPEQTRELAAALAGLCRSGDLILLVGDLGAGKTTFTQGFAAALDVTTPVTSPTFTLAHRYDGRMRVHHLDVYRLEHLSEVYDLDLPELLEDGAVTLIEWGDAIAAALPPQYLELLDHAGRHRSVWSLVRRRSLLRR